MWDSRKKVPVSRAGRNAQDEQFGIGDTYEDDDNERRKRTQGAGLGMVFWLFLLFLLAGVAFGLGLWATIHELGEKESGPPGSNGTCPAFCFNGTAGIPGPAGTCPVSCFNGTNGLNGINGLNGTNGLNGRNGTNGLNGTNGTNGLNGLNGANGTNGLNGINGTNGLNGQGGVLDYAYIFNLGAISVAIDAPILFDNNGFMSGGFTHVASTGPIVIVNSGMFDVIFSISAAEPNQFALYINGTPVPYIIYGSGAGTQQNVGFGIFPAFTGDVIEVVNHSSAAAVTLASVIGGTQVNANAAIKIIRIA